MRSVAQGFAVSSPDTNLPPPPPEAVEHSRQLAEHIAAEIVAEGEWMSFARYMELALYAPGLGYYAAGSRKFGVEGDFVTAPEISPMFARCLALQARQVLEATGGVILELGPGSGLLAADLFEELKSQGVPPECYLLLEVSPDLRERQRRLIAERHPAHLDRFTWIDTLPKSLRGFVIANEVLDVVPCALVNRRDGEWTERGVVLSESGFAWDDVPMPEGELRNRAVSVFPSGDGDYLSEVNFAAEGLVRTLAGALE